MYKMRGVNLRTYKSTKELQKRKRRSDVPVERRNFTQEEREFLANRIQDNLHKEDFSTRSTSLDLRIIILGFIGATLIIWGLSKL